MSEATLDGIDRNEAVALFGSKDENLRLFRDLLGLKVIARGDKVSLQGPAEQVELGVKILDQLRSQYHQHRSIGPTDIRVLIDQLHDGSGVAPSIAREGSAEIVGPLRRLHTKTPGQREYVSAMRQHDLVMCVGPAGTGKTFLAVAQALEEMHQRRIKRIILVRPAVEAGEKLGFLPGDMQAKVNPYLRPLLDALRDMIDFQQVKNYMDNDAIELAPLAFMRGRTLNDSFIILDEAQNTTIPQMQMFLTRMGTGSKIVVTGDTTQVDLPSGTRSGLKDALIRLSKIPGVGIVRMGKGDIVRHSLVQAIVQAYEKPIDARRDPARSGESNRSVPGHLPSEQLPDAPENEP
ncbi:PhoH family protein [bacterium]|nr:PhoH family protein [bacterium]